MERLPVVEACTVLCMHRAVHAGMKPVDNEEAVKLSYSHLESHEYPNMHNNARWDAVSGRAQSLVLQLMERDPNKRLTAQQARPLPSSPVCHACVPCGEFASVRLVRPHRVCELQLLKFAGSG